MGALDVFLPVGHYTQEILIYLILSRRDRRCGARLRIVDLKVATSYPWSPGAFLETTRGRLLYAPYLDAIGAFANASDAVAGSRHIANFDVVDDACDESWEVKNSNERRNARVVKPSCSGN